MNWLSLIRTSTLVVLLATIPCMVGAQSEVTSNTAPPRLRFSVGGGFADNPPLGGGGTGSLGYHLTTAAEMQTGWSPLLVRADGLLAQWDNDQRLWALTGGVVLRAPERWRAAPHLLAGGGGYALPTGGLARGWTLGAGLRVPFGVRAFLIESRIHAYDLGEGGLARVGLGSQGYGRWQYTYMPLSFSVQF